MVNTEYHFVDYNNTRQTKYHLTGSRIESHKWGPCLRYLYYFERIRETRTSSFAGICQRTPPLDHPIHTCNCKLIPLISLIDHDSIQRNNTYVVGNSLILLILGHPVYHLVYPTNFGNVWNTLYAPARRIALISLINHDGIQHPCCYQSF